MSTQCWLRKCSSSSFLPRSQPAFLQGRRRALLRYTILGRAAIFGHAQNNGLQDLRVRAASVGREEMDVRSRRFSSEHVWMGKRSRK